MGRRFAVIGLGHFGISLASALSTRGAEVLAVDSSMDRLDEIKDQVTHTVCADATEPRSLAGLGLEDMDAVIVAIGDDFEATLLAVSQLQDLKVSRLIVRGTTPVHERILQHLGITEIIMPAVEAADRLTNSLMLEGVINSLTLGSNYTIMEVAAPPWMLGRSVQDLGLRERFDVSLITIQRDEERRGVFGVSRRMVRAIIGVPQPTTVVLERDVLVLFGSSRQIQLTLEG